jgi:hypothetical protein
MALKLIMKKSYDDFEEKVILQVKAGVQRAYNYLKILDSIFHSDDKNKSIDSLRFHRY